jgi:hypothetical protein
MACPLGLGGNWLSGGGQAAELKAKLCGGADPPPDLLASAPEIWESLGENLCGVASQFLYGLGGSPTTQPTLVVDL